MPHMQANGNLLLFFVGLLMVAVSSNVHAEFAYLDGSKLKTRLNNENDPVPYVLALGYVLGIHDAFSGISICDPSTAKADQLAAIVIKYLSDHPQELHKSGSDLVRKALSSAFPCKK